MTAHKTLTISQLKLFDCTLTQLIKRTHILESKDYIQHGVTSIFDHCLNVALISLKLACLLKLAVDEKSLITGALLHDYFLYDWHKKESSPSWHGFKHPAIALANARRDFPINRIETDIIINHMFPLTFFHFPRTKEGWLISIADKFCSVAEVFRLQKYKESQWTALSYDSEAEEERLRR